MNRSSSRRSRSPSTSSTASTASSRSGSRTPEKKHKESSSDTKPKTSFDDLFKKTSNTSYYLAQKSEMLLFDQVKETDLTNTEQFVWRKKNQKIGIDKLEPQKQIMLNQFKREETEV